MNKKIKPEHFKRLEEYISMPTVSTQPQNPAMAEALEWWRELFDKAGVYQTKVLKAGDAYPGILAMTKPDKKKKTLLVYGHLDVQPPGDSAEWSSDPYKLALRGGYLFGRGIADNKGQHLAVILAMLDLVEQGKPLNYNVKILLEANEETGSLGLDWMLKKYARQLEADFYVGIDGSMIAKDQPTIYQGCKGINYYRLTVRGSKRELHSGYYGMLVYNPAIQLAKFLGGLTDQDGLIAVPGVRVVADGGFERREVEVREMFGPEDEPRIRKEDLGKLISTQERESTLDVHSLRSGGEPDQVKTAIPTQAVASFSIRTAPGSEAKRVDEAIQQHAWRFFAKTSLEYELELVIAADPGMAGGESLMVEKIANSLRVVSGVEPVITNLSATLPVFSQVAKVYHQPFVLVGFAAPDSNQHAVDEKLPVENFLLAQRFVTRLLTQG
ncbi:MAG: M20/M25/M40 family metallo-hydrolase [Chloroflexi bacterium]|nr:MAG: M20/M25/M40 family metallo-hydrolase [Chloroflexota bacterium]